MVPVLENLPIISDLNVDETILGSPRDTYLGSLSMAY
jgi:hypothetical protein